MQLVKAVTSSGLVKLKAETNFICRKILYATENVRGDVGDVDYQTVFYFGGLLIEAVGYQTGHFSVKCRRPCTKCYYANVFQDKSIDVIWFLCKVGNWITEVCRPGTPQRTVFDAANREHESTQDFDLDKVIMIDYKAMLRW